MADLTDLELGWVVGLFEGEGCIYIERCRDRPRAYLRLCMSSTDLDVLERFQSLVGGRIFEMAGKQRLERQRTRGHKPQYQWRLGVQEDCEDLVNLLYPHLGSRRRAKIEEWRAEPHVVPRLVTYREAGCKAWATRRSRYGPTGMKRAARRVSS